jgi:hypothetical protein
MKYGLFWLLGVPIPILILPFLFSIDLPIRVPNAI